MTAYTTLKEFLPWPAPTRWHLGLVFAALVVGGVVAAGLPRKSDSTGSTRESVLQPTEAARILAMWIGVVVLWRAAGLEST